MKKTVMFAILLALLPACSDSGQQQPAATTATTAAPSSPAPTAGAGSAQAPAATPKQTGFVSISPQQAKAMLDTRKDILVIDVRGQEELRSGFIEGSQLVPIWTVMRGQHNLPKDKPLLLVCAVGGRSYAAGQLLARSGYPEVYNLAGGIEAWKQAGLPLKY